MSRRQDSATFSFYDVPRALWQFLGPERWSFLAFSGLLLTVLCYSLVPPFIVGLTANFLIGYLKTDLAARPSISPEATSALDSATEQLIMERLMSQHRSNRTMIIVAHRISTLKDADKVVVFERGLVIEQGRFAELANDADSSFGRMRALQSVGMPVEPATSADALT